MRCSFITGGEDGYVRLLFFDPDYFTKVVAFMGCSFQDEKEEKELRELEALAKKTNA